MQVIKLETKIKASIELVFNMSRSVDLHKISTSKTKEMAIDGNTSGLMELGDWVTWRAKHLGVFQNLTSKITEMEYPIFFADEMVNGAFESFRHEHYFKEEGDFTILKDVFQYTSPMGVLGKIADVLFLKRYMTRFLMERNAVLKKFAESENGKEWLNT